MIHWRVLLVAIVLALPLAPASPEPSRPWIIGADSISSSFHGLHVVRANSILRFVVVEATSQDMLTMAREPGVRYVAPDDEVELLGTPNDPRFASQWYLQSIHQTSLWDTSTTPAPVGIVDSGTDPTHEDLLNANLHLENATSPGAPVNDTCGHGTATSGLIAAVRDNAIGIAGISNGTLTVVKAFDAAGAGVCVGSWDAIATAVQMAVDDGARVLSLSLGSPQSNSAMDDALAYAADHDVLLLAAAGNSGPCSNCMLYPARDPRVLAVGCSDENNSLCDFTSVGPGLRLLAPGVNVTTLRPGNQYASYSGTSLSTPIAAGVAAYVRGVNPLLDAHAALDVLESTSSPIGSRYGVLDARAAQAGALVNGAILNASITVQPTSALEHIVVASESPQPMSNLDLTNSLYDAQGRLLGTKTTRISLDPAQREDLSFVWNATLAGDFTLTITLSQAPGEVALKDNTFMVQGTAFAPDPTGGVITGAIYDASNH